MKAHDFVERGEAAMVVYTDGSNLVIEGDGSGQISDLAININMEVEKVIIYWDEDDGAPAIYTARYAGVESYEGGDGFTVLFDAAEYEGDPEGDWYDFAPGAAYDVQYIQPAPPA